MELYLSQLVLEVTRRCNMACDHCMRGDAQNVEMSKQVVDRVLDAVQGHGIGMVTFTGGEPTLNVPIIQYFVEQVLTRHIGVGSFYVVTNGKEESKDLVYALINLYPHCDEPEMCTLVCSSDAYHEPVQKSKLYNALKFFNTDGHGPQSDESIILEGRASEMGIGRRDYSPESWELDVMDDYVCVNNTLHISANGNVMSGCDFSFDRIDEESVGNVLKQSLKTIIKRQIKKLKGGS